MTLQSAPDVSLWSKQYSSNINDDDDNYQPKFFLLLSIAKKTAYKQHNTDRSQETLNDNTFQPVGKIYCYHWKV